MARFGRSFPIKSAVIIKTKVGRDYSMSFSDSVTPVEKVTKLTTNSFVDSLTLTEVITKSKVFIRTVANTITLTEKLVKKTSKVIINTLSLVENVIPNKQQGRSFNDHLTLVDAVTKLKVRMLTIPERISLVELVKEFKNGVLVGKWTKFNKPFITWLKQAKPS